MCIYWPARCQLNLRSMNLLPHIVCCFNQLPLLICLLHSKSIMKHFFLHLLPSWNHAWCRLNCPAPISMLYQSTDTFNLLSKFTDNNVTFLSFSFTIMDSCEIPYEFLVNEFIAPICMLYQSSATFNLPLAFMVNTLPIGNTMGWVNRAGKNVSLYVFLSWISHMYLYLYW